MSYWVRGNFKFRVKGSMSVNDIQNQFGYTNGFYDRRVMMEGDEPDHKFFFLPSGSEGSFDIRIKKTTKYMTVFYIGGGLRDVYDIREIKEWFNGIVEKSKRFGMDFSELRVAGFSGEHNDHKLYTVSGFARADWEKDGEKFSYRNGHWVFDVIKDILWHIRCLSLEPYWAIRDWIDGMR